MKKFVLYAVGFILVSLTVFGCANNQEGKKAENEKLSIVTSFYPVYLAVINVTRDVDGVAVKNMTKPQVGCLHDYQLTPEDMKTLEQADVFVINGAGMEAFLDKEVKEQQQLMVVDASKNIQLLENDGEKNPHVWVSVSNAIIQVQNIAAELAKIDPAHASEYQKNADIYIEKLGKLRLQMHEVIDPLPNKNIVTFHEAFPYFAQEFGLHVVDVIAREPGSEPSPKELELTIKKIKELNTRALFAEPQYPAGAAKTIAKESGLHIYALDPVVTGRTNQKDKDYDAYLNIMRENMRVLKEALQ